MSKTEYLLIEVKSSLKYYISITSSPHEYSHKLKRRHITFIECLNDTKVNVSLDLLKPRSVELFTNSCSNVCLVIAEHQYSGLNKFQHLETSIELEIKSIISKEVSHRVIEPSEPSM